MTSIRSLGRHLLPLALVSLSACSTAEFAPARLSESYQSRTFPDHIELFRSSSPTRKYIEIGSASACCSRDPSDMIALLRQKAAESGGDALIGLEIGAKGSVSATVIRYE